MFEWYDKMGNPMGSLEEWGSLFHDKDYCRVAETTTIDNKWISTVWLGLNHNWGDGPPLIFESMVFDHDSGESDLDCVRYATWDEAIAGHEEMVAKWSPPKWKVPFVVLKRRLKLLWWWIKKRFAR